MHPEVERIRSKLQRNSFPLLLLSTSIDGLRGFSETHVEFNFPIVAIVGENGSGKTTIAKAAVCAYTQAIAGAPTFQPGKFFMATPWDTVEGVRLTYAYKHGNETRSHILRKPTSRWRGMPGRPERHVYLLDISRTVPLDALMGYAQVAKRAVKESSSEDLADEYRARLCHILNRDYDVARFAVSDADTQKTVGILGVDTTSYSQFHQGAGESLSLDLLNMLEQVPTGSLLVIDEVEASLHPKAQRRLVQFLLWLCRTRTIQVIVTTHSPYILEELPPEARVLLIRDRDGKNRVIYGASTEFCLTSIDEKDHPELTIFCEDPVSEAMIRELIACEEPDLLRRVKTYKVGPANVVGVLGRLAASGSLPYPAVGVVDGDEPQGGCLTIPGDRAPEVQMFSDLRAMNWPGIAERFGIGFGEMATVLEDAMRGPDHHTWPNEVGDRVRLSARYVTDTLAGIWARQCVDSTTRDEFVQSIRDACQAS